MRSIPDCLAAFSVAAMTNTPDAEERARAAIDAFLLGAPEDPTLRLAALHELYAAFLGLALDSTAALAIKADLEGRIVELAGPPPGGSGPAQHA